MCAQWAGVPYVQPQCLSITESTGGRTAAVVLVLVDVCSVSWCGFHAASVSVKDEPTSDRTAAVQAQTGGGDERQAHSDLQLAGTAARTEMQMLQVRCEPGVHSQSHACMYVAFLSVLRYL